MPTLSNANHTSGICPPIQWFLLLFQKARKQVSYVPGILFLLGPKLWIKPCPCWTSQSLASRTRSLQPTSLLEEFPWWMGLLTARTHAHCQVHSQGFFKHSCKLSWHIRSCDTGLCPSSTPGWSSTSCTVPFTGRDGAGRSDEESGWEVLAVMLCVSHLQTYMRQKPIVSLMFSTGGSAGLF